jgi:hypothetical protein
VQAQVEGMLSGAVAHARQALVRLERGREVLGAYAPARPKPVHRIDTAG